MSVTLDVLKCSDPVQLKDHPVKVTALSCLREALIEERYEEVKDIIDIAKEFGASHWDIQVLLLTRA